MKNGSLVVVALIGVMALAGCIQSQAAGQEGEGVLLADTQDVEPWSSIDFAASGAAGEWLFFYQPFPEPLEDVTRDLDVEVVAHGDGSTVTGLLTSEPDLVIDWGDGPEIRMRHTFETRGPLYVDRDGGDASYAKTGTIGSSVSGGEFTGFAFIVGASTPWSAQVRIDLEDAQGGTVTEPHFLSRGQDVQLFSDYERLLPLPLDGAVAGEIRLDATLATTGWTHVQHEYDAVQPNGVREYEFVFPDGHEVSGSGSMTGYHLGGGSAGSSNWLDYCGAVAEDTGELSVRMAYVQTQIRFETAAVHLPMGPGDLPDGFQPVRYCDSNWPFQDPLSQTHSGPGPMGGWETHTLVD